MSRQKREMFFIRQVTINGHALGGGSYIILYSYVKDDMTGTAKYLESSARDIYFHISKSSFEQNLTLSFRH